MKKLNLTLILAVLLLSVTSFAQKLPNSTVAKMSRLELGNHYVEKSKRQKLLGSVLIGTGIATFIAATSAAQGESNAAAPLFVTSLLTLSIGNPVLSAGAKNKGRSEMLLRQPAPDESPEDVKALARKYRSQATISSITGWTLLLGGIALLGSSIDTDSGTVAVLGLTSMFASVPVWMNAAKNKGRVSILLQKEYVPVSYKSNPSMPSLGISIPIFR